MADQPPLFFERRLGGLFPAKRLPEVLNYSPETGALSWNVRPVTMFSTPAAAARWNGRYAGSAALTAKSNSGYSTGVLFGRHVKAHAVAWAFVHGRWPKEIDHINGDKADNRLANLREVDRRENSKNRSLRSDNRTGVVGISERKGKWLARIQDGERNICLGTFSTKEGAVEARRSAERDLGYHPNHGRRA